MRISVTLLVILISTYIVSASVLDPVIENVVHLKASKLPGVVSGIWKKKTIWKPRWVKEWKSAKIMKPVWRKVWSPVLIREWVPIPKPPPGWESKSTALSSVAPTQNGNIPLWDPMPYPESQRPPPPSPLSSSAVAHGESDEYGDSASTTFTQEQIKKIIGIKRYKKAPEYSESAAHSESSGLLQPIRGSWRATSQSLGFRRWILPEPPSFLLPPQISGLNHHNLRFEKHIAPNEIFEKFNNNSANTNTRESSFRSWIPIPSRSQRGNNITNSVNVGTKHSNYLYKLPLINFDQKRNKMSENEKEKKNSATRGQENYGILNQTPNFIQQAKLVGEYHYKAFDYRQHVPKRNEEITNPKAALPAQSKALKHREDQANSEETEISGITKKRADHKQNKEAPITSVLHSNVEQEKAVITEIFPVFNSTSTPLPVNHKFVFRPLYKAIEYDISNGSHSLAGPVEKDELSSEANKGRKSKPFNQFQLEFVYSNEDKPYGRNSSEIALVKALQKNFTKKIEAEIANETAKKETTTTFPYTTSTSASTNEKTTISSVFIVTPINQDKS